MAVKRLLVLWLFGMALLCVLLPADADTPVRSLKEIRQHNIILQQYDLSCGAAALATILRFQHGEEINEHQVAIGLISREAYLANPHFVRVRQGFSLLDMKRFVEQLGYEGKAFGDASIEDLINLAPAIVPIRQYGYNHFVVFRGIWAGNVLVGDPAYGNRTLPLTAFKKAWINYAELGHVLFSVNRRDALIPPNQLAVSSADFPLLLTGQLDAGELH